MHQKRLLVTKKTSAVLMPASAQRQALVSGGKGRRKDIPGKENSSYLGGGGGGKVSSDWCG